jgi:hypothetical protein
MNPLLKEIRVLEGQVVRIVHPVTGAIIKEFQAGEAIVEKDWNLAEGWLEANLGNSVKAVPLTPVVQAAAVPVADAPAAETAPASS